MSDLTLPNTLGEKEDEEVYTIYETDEKEEKGHRQADAAVLGRDKSRYEGDEEQKGLRQEAGKGSA